MYNSVNCWTSDEHEFPSGITVSQIYIRTKHSLLAYKCRDDLYMLYYQAFYLFFLLIFVGLILSVVRMVNIQFANMGI